MRNQTWDQQGEIVADIELFLEAGMPKAKDWLTGLGRDATSEEAELLRDVTREDRIAEARERFITEARKQKGVSPLGQMMYDLAVAQGLMEPEG